MNTIAIDSTVAASILGILGYIVKASSSATRMQVLIEMLVKITDKHDLEIDGLKERDRTNAIPDKAGRRRLPSREQ